MLHYISFNIRLDNGQDGAHNFVYRKPGIVRAIRSAQPEIIGFQEVLPHVGTWLRETFPEYTFVGCGRSDTLEDEQVCIAFRWDRMQLISASTFWLSPTPFVPGSRYPEQSMCPRTVTEVLLHLTEEKRVLRVVNTHLDHEGTQARELGLGQILRQLEHPGLFPDAPVILGGDFNAQPGDPEMRLLRDSAFVNLTENIGITYHGYDGNHPSSIDYICTRGPIDCRAVRKWDWKENGLYLSDHFPVEATLAFPSCV